MRRMLRDTSSCTGKDLLKGLYRSLWTLPPGPFPTPPCIAFLLICISWGIEVGAEDALVKSVTKIARIIRHEGPMPTETAGVAVARTALYWLLLVIIVLVALRGAYARQVYVAIGKRWHDELVKALQAPKQISSEDDGPAVTSSTGSPEAGSSESPPVAPVLSRRVMIVRRGGVAARSAVCGTAKFTSAGLWLLFGGAPFLGVLLALCVTTELSNSQRHAHASRALITSHNLLGTHIHLHQRTKFPTLCRGFGQVAAAAIERRAWLVAGGGSWV